MPQVCGCVLDKRCKMVAEAGFSGNQQSDTDEPMSSTPEVEHVCVLVYGGFSGDAVEGDLISIDPGKQSCLNHKPWHC